MARVKPKQSHLPDVLPYFKASAMLYTAIVMLLPLIAFIMSIVNKHSTPANVNWIYLQLLELLKAVGGVMPGPGDYVLAAIAILYLKKWKVSVGLLIAGGFLWLISWSSPEVITLVTKIGDQSAFGLILSCMYSALAAQFLVCSLLLPAVVAKQRKKARWRLLSGLTLALGWIPPIWVLLLFLVFRNDKDASPAVAPEDSSSAKPARKVHQNMRKRKKGFKKR